MSNSGDAGYLGIKSGTNAQALPESEDSKLFRFSIPWCHWVHCTLDLAKAFLE